jgi:heme/copper-type cytochrome/quinol oxidase subunit 2
MQKRGWLYGLCAALLGAIILFAPLPARASQPAERTIHVEAGQYAYTPGEIHVNQGDQVTIELTSSDVVHGVYIDGYDISVTSDPGQTESMTFTAEKAGMFRLRCNVTCGAMHPFMTGKLVIGNNDWLVRTLGLMGLGAAAVIFMPRKQEGI